MAERVSIVLFSGTSDKAMTAAITASGAVATGKKAELLVTFWGLAGFRRGAAAALPPGRVDLFVPGLSALLERQGSEWMDHLRRAKDSGRLRVLACATTMHLLGIGRDELDPIVDGVMEVGEFIERAAQGEIAVFV